jgi:acyl dehydratase
LEASTWPLIARGPVFEDHEVGRTFAHAWGRTVHASDNIVFSTQMLAFNPLYLDRDHVDRSGPRGEVVNPMLVLSVVLGLSVEDLSEGGGPFLGANRVNFHRDVHVGETLYATSTVLAARPSASQPDSGVVTWRTIGRTGAGDTVIDFERSNLVRRADHSVETLPVPDGYAEDFLPGQRFRHARGRTITDLDLNGLTLLVMNTAQAHFSHESMVDTVFGERINFGGLTLALTIGLATEDTTGQAVREIGLDAARFPTPVRNGDTIQTATEVRAIDRADNDSAIVTFHHLGINQRREVACEVDRRTLLRTRSAVAASGRSTR